MADAFLDSTALIELVFRDAEQQARVAAAASTDGQRITSRYVVFEIARGFLRPLLTLYNKSLVARTFAELHRFAHGRQQIYRHHWRETMLGAFDDFLENLAQSRARLTQRQMLDSFRGWLGPHIRRGWRQIFREAAIINPTRCRDDFPAPARRDDGCYEQALPTTACGQPENCGLRAYLASRRDDFHAIRARLAAIPAPDAETSKRIAALDRLLGTSPDAPFAGRDCWRCGDAIICHEAPTGAVVVSKNAGHFAPICAALGREFRGYT